MVSIMAMDNVQDLMPEDLAEVIPLPGATQDEDDPVAQVKLFMPYTAWTWYITEYDRSNRMCFGLVVGDERELGYFSLEQLEEIRGLCGVRVKRDSSFQPQPVSECC